MRSLFAAHPDAALEFSFFKVNAGPISLLVDWIDRRRIGERWLRVSVHSPLGREMLFEDVTRAEPAAGDGLTEFRTSGSVGEVSWSLDIDPGVDRIAPDIPPAGRFRMADLALESAPHATFSGTIRHRGRDFDIRHARGHLSHYWGRQLPVEWWWVSASQFDGVDLTVEAGVIRSRMWGASVVLPLGYLYLAKRAPERGRRVLWMAPLGLARVAGSPEAFTMTIRRPGASTATLVCKGREYGDLGEGIVNTLVGDVEVWEGRTLTGSARGSAALERRTGIV